VDKFVFHFFFVGAVGALAFFATADAEQLAVEPKMSVEVGYISGGNSQADRALLREIEDDFNLQLSLLGSDGGYNTAGSVVKIIDDSGETLVQTVSEGPLFFAKLEPGNYTIEAEYQGEIQQQQVTISGEKQTEIALNF
jgi:hypothetical protein